MNVAAAVRIVVPHLAVLVVLVVEILIWQARAFPNRKPHVEYMR